MGEIVTDTIGTWEKIGELISPYDEWRLFGEHHKVVSGQYRLKFSSERIDLVRSFAWLRVVYISGLVSPARKIYPKKEPMRMFFPIPEEFQSVGVDSQQFEILKLFRKRQSRDYLWSLSIEQLILTEKETENTVTLILDNPSYSKDPIRGELWVSVFNQTVTDKRGLILPVFEVGRFYQVIDNSVESDPVILEATNGKLTVAFTAPEIIQPGTLYVRIIY